MASALRDSAVGLIGIRGRKFTRIVVLAGLIACCAAVTGCGGDDEKASTTPASTTPAPTETAPAAGETSAETSPGAESAPGTETSPGAETAPPAETSPESMPGGAGDEEPARTLALLTGRGGTITPRVVRVPAFIAVKVELRSADGAAYSLRFGGTTISTGQSGPGSTTLTGLRPGAAVVGRPEGAGNAVRIEATAEPGP